MDKSRSSAYDKFVGYVEQLRNTECRWVLDLIWNVIGCIECFGVGKPATVCCSLRNNID